jgi:hypothetical protein
VAEAITELAKTFAGQLLQPTALGYEEARRVHNGLIDKRPALIAKSHFLPDLTEAAIDTMVDAFEKCPSSMSEILLEHVHGAAVRVGIGDTAFPLRAVGYNFLVLAQWMSPADNGPCIAWARETYAAMQPFVGLGRYVNYLDDDESGDPAAAAYGPNYRRLQELKARYDPSNFFHMNQNIRPIS